MLPQCRTREIGECAFSKSTAAIIYHIGNTFKIEGSWFEFESFCYKIFSTFPKKIGGGEKQKRSHMFDQIRQTKIF